MIVCDTMASPVGELLLTAKDGMLTGIYFEQSRHGPGDASSWVHAAGHAGPEVDVLSATRAQLSEYFAGERTTFTVPLAARGTPFQERVWGALRDIRFGETISYAELARRVESPKAVRAVGAANGRNPLPLIVPCHRVIGADGSLTGFGGGIERKQWLLQHEGALKAAAPALPFAPAVP
jgi:methylated-DNA-[protein]-cysteine S-methyltransferase